jgi:multiple sugar transport system permease protein/putative aldouronate transport system permease protein
MTTTTPAVTAGARRARHPNRPIWEENPTVLGRIGKALALGITVMVILFPLWAVVITSFSTQESINSAGGLVLVPHGLTLKAYASMLSGGEVTRALIIGLVITVIGTVISMVVSALCAYGLSRRGSFGHRTLLMTLIVTMFFSGGLIPTFLVVANLFHGYNQYWSLILPSAISVFNILIMRAFYMGTATDLIDAAKIDGAGDFRILWSVVLPTSKSVTAVMALFYGVSYWNNWFNVLLYMPADSTKWPIQYVLYQYVTQGAQIPGVGTNMAGAAIAKTQVAPLSLQMGMLVLTLIPILAIYPFVQKHFAKGVLLGAIKG